MKSISILNHVLGPVMRGPSSSHTAGAFHLGSMARSLLDGTPQKAVFAFDPAGSLAATYVAQGADRGFAMGLMNKPLTDDSFHSALDDASSAGMDITFEIRELANPTHPNTAEMDLTSGSGEHLKLIGRSIGGGEVEITHIDGRTVLFSGSAFEALVEVPTQYTNQARDLLASDNQLLKLPVEMEGEGHIRLMACRTAPLPTSVRQSIEHLDESARVWQSSPVYFLQPGNRLFSSASELVQIAEQRGKTLGQIALNGESQLLGISEEEVLEEILRRYDIMLVAVQCGLDREFTGMQMLPACAGSIFDAEAAGKLSVRSLHTRAAARAMAVMHVDSAMGVVCAAPTGGSAGVIPGTIITLAEERSLSRRQIGLALLAAGSIGVVVATRATFAAEVAGCQVEIGASGAMAAAAVVDAGGGTPQQACDAAAIAFQNSMGSVCDLLHGTVEIPCHTRNGTAAASAFVNADLILGGYRNVIPLDETIDAVYAVGRAMPSELRCTSKGGLAIAPSAQALASSCHDSTCDGCKKR